MSANECTSDRIGREKQKSPWNLRIIRLGIGRGKGRLTRGNRWGSTEAFASRENTYRLKDLSAAKSPDRHDVNEAATPHQHDSESCHRPEQKAHDQFVLRHGNALSMGTFLLWRFRGGI